MNGAKKMGVETMLIGAIVTLWGVHMISWRNLNKRVTKCERDREQLWKEIFKLSGIKVGERRS